MCLDKLDKNDYFNLPTKDLIRKYRKEHSSYKSQEKFAEGLGVSHATVSKWENGHTAPRLDEFLNICDLLNCDPCYLLKENSPRFYSSEQISEQLGLSPDAVDTLILLNKNDNVQIDLLSSLIKDETLLTHMAAVAHADYGQISQTFGTLDPFTGKRIGRIISPDDLHAIDKQQLFSLLSDFLDNYRKTKEGSSNLEID